MNLPPPLPLFGNSETLAVFSLAIVSMLLYNYLKFQTFYYPSPDGDLYLSIARNFIQNGHFIQTARPHEVNMIVPPGVPLIFTVVLGLTYSYVNIIIVQYVLFGLSAALLAKAAGFFSRTTFYIVPVLFVSACVYIGTPNPSSLLTETYTVFLLSLSLFIFLRPDRSAAWKASLLLPIQFFALLVRPVVGGLLAAVYAGMAVLVVRKKIPFKRLAAYSAAFAAVLALNTWVNYRETGYAVMLEDYGAPAAYLANNPNTKTTHYDSSLAFEFGDSYFKEVYTDPDLDMYQKSALLGPRTAEFVKENLPFVLENTRVKYEQLYQTRYWNYNFYCFFLALVVFWWKKRLSPASALLLAAAFFLVTIVPAFGLFILRYSVPCIPFYALINGSLYGLAIEAVGRRLIPLEKEKEALHE